MLHTCTECWVRFGLLVGSPHHQFVREPISDGGQFLDGGTGCLYLERRGNSEGNRK